MGFAGLIFRRNPFLKYKSQLVEKRGHSTVGVIVCFRIFGAESGNIGQYSIRVVIQLTGRVY